MVGDFLEVFMNDFSVFGSSFEDCLNKLEKVLKHCMETNLVLSWDKSFHGPKGDRARSCCFR